MRIIPVLILSLLSVCSFSQSAQDLEAQLKEAAGSKEKMTLNYSLANVWLKTDAKKSVEYAKAAHNKSLELHNNAMSAESA